MSKSRMHHNRKYPWEEWMKEAKEGYCEVKQGVDFTVSLRSFKSLLRNYVCNRTNHGIKTFTDTEKGIIWFRTRKLTSAKTK